MRAIPVEGHGFYEDAQWSPDGSKIAYTDNSFSLYVLDVESGGLGLRHGAITEIPHQGVQSGAGLRQIRVEVDRHVVADPTDLVRSHVE